MDTTETRNKVDELKAHPELANTPGCEIEELREAVDPIYWFLLLMEQPQFANRCDWSKLTPGDREKLEAKGIRP